MYRPTDDRLSKSAKISILYIVMVFIFFSYIFRLFSMQIVRGDDYKIQSKRNANSVTVIPA